MNIQRRLQPFSSFFIFRSEDDETAEAYLWGFYNFRQRGITDGIEETADKSGNYCHTGNTLNFRFWEKAERLYGKWWWLGVVVVGGSVGVAKVKDHLQALPGLPQPEQVKHVERASEKNKNKKQPWQR